MEGGPAISKDSRMVLDAYSKKIKLPGYRGLNYLMAAVIKGVKDQVQHYDPSVQAKALGAVTSSITAFHKHNEVSSEMQKFYRSQPSEMSDEFENDRGYLTPKPNTTAYNLLPEGVAADDRKGQSRKSASFMADPEKAFGLYSAVIGSGQQYGYLAADGSVQTFENEEGNAIKTALKKLGGGNYKDLLAGGIFVNHSSNINGKQQYEVSIPLNKDNDGVLKALGYLDKDVVKKLTSGNKLILHMDAETMRNAFGSGEHFKVNRNGVLSQKSEDIGEVLEYFLEDRKFKTGSFPGLEQGVENKEVALPLSIGVFNDGYLTVDNGMIIYMDNGTTRVETQIPWREYKDHPSETSDKIMGALTKASSSMLHQKTTENRVRQEKQQQKPGMSLDQFIKERRNQ
jgi:hypothetical protein